MDVSTTYFKSFNTIITGTGAGAVYTVPTGCYAVVSTSRIGGSFSASNSTPTGTVTSYFSLTIGGTVVQDADSSPASLSGFASSGQSISISNTYSATGDYTITAMPSVKYQILVLTNGTHT